MDVMGLVDSGATVNVLPYEVGLQLDLVGMTAGPTFGWLAL
jgi:hypothetical protein